MVVALGNEARAVLLGHRPVVACRKGDVGGQVNGRYIHHASPLVPSNAVRAVAVTVVGRALHGALVATPRPAPACLAARLSAKALPGVASCADRERDATAWATNEERDLWIHAPASTSAAFLARLADAWHLSPRWPLADPEGLDPHPGPLLSFVRSRPERHPTRRVRSTSRAELRGLVRALAEKRAEHAVIAWMRHQTTKYDDMSIARVKGARREVRADLAKVSRGLLEAHRKPALHTAAASPLCRALAVRPAD